MTTLTQKFSEMKAEIDANAEETHSQLVSMGGTLENIQAAIDGLNSSILQMGRTLTATIALNSPCIDCEGQTVVVPPVATDPIEASTENCQRSQAFIDAVGRMLAVWDTFSTFDLAANFALITSSIQTVIDELAAGDTIPLPSFPEGSRIVADIVAFTAYNLIFHTSIKAEYDLLRDDLINALSASPSAAEAKSQYDAIMAAGFSSSVLGELASATAYNALYSYFFDPASMPDLTPYDGGICAIGGCYTFSSQAATASGFTRQYIVWGSPFTGARGVAGATDWDKNVWLVGNFQGWRITNLGAAGCRVVYNPDGAQGVAQVLPGNHYDLPDVTTYVLIDDTFTDGAFSITLCSPGAF